jgi:hypothetical protein
MPADTASRKESSIAFFRRSDTVIQTVSSPELVHWVTAPHEPLGTMTTLQSCGFFEADAQFLNASSSAASFV